MATDENEEQLLRSVALQNSQSILQARQRAERELIEAKTALERNTDELAQLLAMMRATLESTTDAILVTDAQGKITGYNQKFVAMWQLSADVMATGVHRRLLEVASRQFQDPASFRSRIEEIYAASPPESYDLIELLDGRVIERFSRIQWIDQRNVGRVWSFRDITERRRAEEALCQAQADLSRHAKDLEKQVAQRTAHLHETIQSLEGVCYTIAHDLRAPLRAVQGFTRIIREDYAPAFDAEGQRLADRIVAAATRMDTLIQDLLEYAKLSHIDLPCASIELGEVVNKVVEILGPEITARSGVISIQPLPVVWGNPTIVQQIFNNLLTNALKFVAPGVPPAIEIFAEDKPAGPRVFVRDNGIGIDPKYHQRVFDMFQRLHHDEDQYSGTGVGLAIVKKGIERIGGRVGIMSNTTQGTTFYLDFKSPRKES